MCTRPCFGLTVAWINAVAYGIASIGIISVLANKDFMNQLFADNPDAAKVLKGILITYVVITSIMTVISGLLIAGIIKRRAKYMRPFVLVSFMTVTVGVIMAFVNAFVSSDNRVKKFFTSMLAVGIQCGLLYPIYTLYKDIQEENQGTARITH
ncbi:uncharacterized protein LOC131997818 [Stomoxys calcitrans]|uniref:uncharacterized protein LOC131997818 n=1 Tax=Stomoxys calcitrans TaxID=35570 RepID=UPI0027E259AA|nr:uncharacterized protein LOC131997818 [Stomoxys calcitrans]